MILARSPLRIPLGGGGTDLASYYESHGGLVLAAAITRYVHVALNPAAKGFLLRYPDKEERRAQADKISHPIVREAVRALGRGLPGLELASFADLPFGMGLGSSGSFTTALVAALSAARGRTLPAPALARAACEIEIDRLARPTGKQDQYAAAFGGLRCYVFKPGGAVVARPIRLSPKTERELERRLLLFSTGKTRAALPILRQQQAGCRRKDFRLLENLHAIKEIGERSLAALERGDLSAFGDLINEHWRHKKSRSSLISDSGIDRAIVLARRSGAAAKLIGAGGGGAILCLADEPARTDRALRRAGLKRVPFQFDREGTKVFRF
jgi:D-glycero-alpha-D-manno-heptose-7-phosphate kinase